MNAQAQAIQKAYQAYATLFNDPNATREEQDAQYEKYLNLRETPATEQAYNTYIQAAQAAESGKETLKTLRKQGEQAATRARYEIVGTMQEKLAAIQIAWKPFLEEIARVEAEITENYKIADKNFDAWQGLNQ